MIIDSHTHVLPPVVRDERTRYIEIDAAFASIYREAKVAIASADDLLSSMEQHEISCSVAVNYNWSTLDFCRLTNDYILESAARHPQKIIGFCSVPDFTTEGSLREIERCAQSGARGVGELRPDFQSAVFPDRDAMSPFAELLSKYNLVVLLHLSEPVGHLYPGKGTATPALVMPFLEAFQNVTCICAHWGGGLPFYFLMPEVKSTLENVYFDSAASPFLYSPSVYSVVSRLVGAEKILFGSDYPLMPPARVLSEIDASGLSSTEKDCIVYKNACKLFDMS